MRLFTLPQAPNPRRVHIFLAEKGVEVPCEMVDVMRGESRTPEFLEKRNPLGGIPVLELDDGSHIAESVAICRYFEELHPEPPLFGKGPEETARIEMWSRRVELKGMQAVGQVWIHGSPLTRRANPNQIAEAAELNRKLAHRFYDFLDASLAKTPCIAGDSFTIADILALTVIDFAARLVELPYDAGLSNLAAWHARVNERPSVRANPASGLPGQP